MGILLSCKETTSRNIPAQISEDSVYAKEFIKKAKEIQGLLLPGIITLVKDKETAIAVA
jgi:hypothetical protein